MTATQPSLNAQLSTIYDKIHANEPAHLSSKLRESTAEIKKTFDPSKAIQPGQKLPSFSLPDAYNKTITSDSLLGQGPLLILFYRGSWCPFCNLFLRAYHSYLDKFKSYGVQLVAITAELPEQGLLATEKNDLQYPVLSDVGCKLAKQLGIVWQQPEYLRAVFEKGIGLNWEKNYGQQEMDVAIPSTILVGRDGVVREICSEANYHERMDPIEAVEWIEKHKAGL